MPEISNKYPTMVLSDAGPNKLCIKHLKILKIQKIIHLMSSNIETRP